MSFDSKGVNMMLGALKKYIEPCVCIRGVAYGACDGWKLFYAEK